MEISELYIFCKDVNLRLSGVIFSHGRDGQMQQQNCNVQWTSLRHEEKRHGDKKKSVFTK